MQSSILGRGHSLGRACFVVVAIEVGLLLLTLPWTAVWVHDLQGASGLWHTFWLSPYFRGAISGLGLLNLWAAAGEITHFRL
ncbi:MAG: hypothetical protein ACRD1Y_07705 [Terriglobales bacterium]